MKTRTYLTSLASILVLIFVMSACSSNRFIGTWKPVTNPSGDNDHMRVESFVIGKDKTFSIKMKPESKRKDISGTYTIEGEKIIFTSSDFRKKIEGTVESDGRLKVVEGDQGGVYFAKS